MAGTYRVTVPNFGTRDAARRQRARSAASLHVDPEIVATR